MAKGRSEVWPEIHTADTQTDHYRPQRSCGKVMFLHLSVILFTGGLCHGDPPGQRPPRQRSSWTETPRTETPRQRPPDRDPQTETPPMRGPESSLIT